MTAEQLNIMNSISYKDMETNDEFSAFLQSATADFLVVHTMKWMRCYTNLNMKFCFELLRIYVIGVFMSWSWIYLILAGFFEIGWPIGLKIAQGNEWRVMGIIIAVSCMMISGCLLWLAQKEIPLGTSYAVWTGIGAAGTFLVGIWFFDDASSLGRYFGIILIISGVVILKLAY